MFFYAKVPNVENIHLGSEKMKIIPSSEEEKKPRMYFECYLYRKSNVKYDLVKQGFISVNQRQALIPTSTCTQWC